MTRFATLAVHAGWEDDVENGLLVPPIVLSTSFLQSSPGVPYGDYDYSRTGNTTRTSLETAIACLEGGKHGLVFSSGCMALCTLIHLLEAHSHLILIQDIYGGSSRYLKKVATKCCALEVSSVDMTDITNITNALARDTRMIWMESPTNPTLTIPDIKAVTDAVHQYNRDIIVVVDNTFMSPFFQKPLELGADIVVHSVTKFLNGHGDVLMGAIVTNEPRLYERIKFLQYTIGGVPSPFDCYLANRGLKTLHLRMERQAENAMHVAELLEKHPKVTKVIFPGLPSHPQHHIAKKQFSGFGSMISFNIKGDLKTACIFAKATKLIKLAESLGGVKTLIELPAIMTHGSIAAEERAALGITDSFFRLSVGIEDKKDLIDDLEQALSQLP